MGANDAREQLEAAKAECVRLERERAAALAVIEKAPHAYIECHTNECECWKSTVDTSAGERR